MQEKYVLLLCKHSAETTFIEVIANERILTKAPAKLIILYAKFDTKRIFVFSDANLLYSVGSTTNRSE